MRTARRLVVGLYVLASLVVVFAGLGLTGNVDSAGPVEILLRSGTRRS